MEPLEKAARRLRAAVSTERFPAIPDLAADYVELTIEQARSLAPGSPEAARLQAEAGELLEWSRRTILAQKAHLGPRSRLSSRWLRICAASRAAGLRGRRKGEI